MSFVLETAPTRLIRSRAMRRLTGALGCGLVAAFGVAGCTKNPGAGLSPSYLIIDQLTGASGASPSKLGSPVSSDVITFVTQQVGGQSVKVPTVFSDPGQVVFRLALRDPGGTTAPTTPSATNFITVTRYHVQFIRADGRNTQGVDVPYAFDSAITTTVGTSGATAAFSLVRIQSKEEAPLLALTNDSGADVISTIAQVTFYGTDQAGHDVSVMGEIGVDFADWGDPTSAGS